MIRSHVAYSGVFGFDSPCLTRSGELWTRHPHDRTRPRFSACPFLMTTFPQIHLHRHHVAPGFRIGVAEIILRRPKVVPISKVNRIPLFFVPNGAPLVIPPNDLPCEGQFVCGPKSVELREIAEAITPRQRFLLVAG